MPTTITKSVGSAGGRDYTTPQAWEDAKPANLVTSDQIWRGEAYNDSEFAAGATVLTISGSTSDATRYAEFTAASGQSFQDHANVRTNALKYNQANGVGLNRNDGYGQTINIVEQYARMSRVQVKCTGNGGTAALAGDADNKVLILKDIIVDSAGRVGAEVKGVGAIGVNILVFKSGAGESGFIPAYGATLIGCSAIRTSDTAAAGTAFEAHYNSQILQSCCSFGFNTVTSGTFDTTNSKNNATDQASGLPGSNNQHSISFTSTSPFVNSTAASQDSRLAAGTNLDNNGFLDSTNAPNDISGQARGASPEIGHWELAAAAASIVPTQTTSPNYKRIAIGSRILSWILFPGICLGRTLAQIRSSLSETIGVDTARWASIPMERDIAEAMSLCIGSAATGADES